MKKLFLVLAFAFVGIFTANAQVWIGGSAGADITKTYYSFSIAPEVGYMIPNTPFTVAAAVNYSHGHSDYGNSNTIILSPYFRYVPCTIGEKFSLFLDSYSNFFWSSFRSILFIFRINSNLCIWNLDFILFE